VTKCHPKQILRYYEDPKNTPPLWVSSKNQSTPTNIPVCNYCGEQRICEFQILPQLIYYLKVGDDDEPIDWGILSIYTCPNSCSGREASSVKDTNFLNPYIKEFVFVQPM